MPKTQQMANSKKAVGLIVPDVHEQIRKLKRILLKHNDVEWVVFLGDMMDTFAGLTEQTYETILWWKAALNNPNYTFIWGNHDMHYAFPIEGVMCSGFDPLKLKLVQAQMTTEQWNKLKLMHWVGTPNEGNNTQPTEYLLSHAGLHPYLLHPVKGFDKATLIQQEEEAMYMLRYGQQVTPFVAPGMGVAALHELVE
jgi:predicted phosphodiesterase